MSDIADIRGLVNPFGDKGEMPYLPRSQKVEDASHDIDQDVVEALNLFKPRQEGDWRIKKYCDDEEALPGLLPEKIDTVLQNMKKMYAKESYEYHYIGGYISQLMSISYKKLGSRHFTLMTGEHMIAELAYHLRSIDAMTIDIIGNIGFSSCEGLKNSVVRLSGDAQSNTCYSTERCTVTVDGDCGEYFAQGSKHSLLTILGDAGPLLGAYSKESEFIVHGDIGYKPFYHAKRCVFKTPNEDTFKKALKSLSRKANNRIQLVEIDGTVLEEVKNENH